MIARTWHGRVPTPTADVSESFLERTGLADYARTPGYRGVLVLRAGEDAVTRWSGGHENGGCYHGCHRDNTLRS